VASSALNMASRTRSDVGRVPLGGTANRRPPADPATILVTGTWSLIAVRPVHLTLPAHWFGRISPAHDSRPIGTAYRLHLAIFVQREMQERPVSQDSIRQDSLRTAETAVEQRHVDRVYARLAEVRSETEAMRDRGYQLAHGADRRRSSSRPRC